MSDLHYLDLDATAPSITFSREAVNRLLALSKELSRLLDNTPSQNPSAREYREHLIGRINALVRDHIWIADIMDRTKSTEVIYF